MLFRILVQELSRRPMAGDLEEARRMKTFTRWEEEEEEVERKA